MIKEIYGNWFDIVNNYKLAFVTTNGFVKRNGCGVMGAGIAKQFKTYYPDAERWLGDYLSRKGNHVGFIGKFHMKPEHRLTVLGCFPVKHSWEQDADINLIRRSALELLDLVNKHKLSKILINRPGCGNGRLAWSDVKHVLDEVWDERFHVITFD